MIKNLGKALTILANQEAGEYIMHDDVDQFGAPSECHDLVYKGERRRWRQARRHAEAVTQRPFRIIMKEAQKRGFRSKHKDVLIGKCIAATGYFP